MAYPSFTKTYHHSSYAAISPTRPELSVRDKTVIVTGAGDGSIGGTVALSFAQAGARKIALMARTETSLKATKDKIVQAFPDAEVMVVTADVSKAESVGVAAHRIRATLGAWDVFAHCAAVAPTHTTIAGADEDEWWHAFEINTRFSSHFAKHFLPKCRPNATYIGVNAGACHLPGSNFPKSSAYCASKLAIAKLDEFLAAENPHLRVFTVHPGIVQTNMTKGFIGDSRRRGIVLDDAELVANFMVWLASPESDFLRGRYVWCNWDVEEMIAKRAEIESNPTLLTMTLGGWPFQ
ncbi:hypothetical protein PV08_10285 [Exophiala spinifera]|uniref:Uncharacterized protein n=1 Tax=Exophiala spinifera TaxID=91928 RepID=A0A0D1Y7U8_9EURO|nr:uncharacterized protein PV08_10285 [Exophiala spinifera]KIW10986.1 hypothetical protein PV08_10285 [Exophiala spinifera]